MKFFLKILFLFCFAIIFSLVGVELLFQTSPDFFQSESQKNWFISPERKALVKKVQARLYQNWSVRYEDRPNPFYQPWVVFENSGFDNSERIKKIVESTIFPKNEHWVVPDVFRNPEEKKWTEYTVDTNSLGFRDLERQTLKSKKTIRIIALGSYVTFGYALNDQDSYVRKLEKKLNAHAKPGYKYEVWNWGRQGATAVMGYALLKNEVLKYSPDLILFDYGWADYFTNHDMISDSPNSIKTFSKFFKNICYLNSITSKILSSTEVCERLTSLLSHSKNRSKSLTQWTNALQATVELAKVNKTPLLILKLNPQMPVSMYSNHINEKDRIFFSDLMPAIYNLKASEEEKNNFWSKPNWLTEIGIMRENLKGDNVYWRTNSIQYSSITHSALADQLYEKIIAILK